MDVKKAVRNAVLEHADHCKALEAHTPSEGREQVSLILVPCSLWEQPHEYYTAYVTEDY